MKELEEFKKSQFARLCQRVDNIERLQAANTLVLGGSLFPDLHDCSKKDLYDNLADILKNKLKVTLDQNDICDVQLFQGKINGVKITFSNKRPGSTYARLLEAEYVSNSELFLNVGQNWIQRKIQRMARFLKDAGGIKEYCTDTKCLMIQLLPSAQLVQ